MIKNEEFVHLHLHDQYSILDGYGTAKQYCKRAVELGFKAMALTNHGNVDGVIKWQAACKEAGIKSIIGIEAYMVPDLLVKKEKEKRYHVVLLAKNIAGFHSLLKMLSVANLDGFYWRPRIDPNLLLSHCDDLVIGSACMESYINMPDGIELLKQLGKRTEVYLEVMPHAMKEQARFNTHVLKVASDLKLPIVATNDCHYPEKNHAKLQEVLLCMQSKKKMKDKDRWKFDVNTLWLYDTEEMVLGFEKQGVLTGSKLEEAMITPGVIADICNLEIKKQEVYLPKPPIPGKDNLSEEDQLIQLTLEGLETKCRMHSWIKAANISVYEDRISEELQIIISQGFARYFLIVWELIEWCRKNDIMVGPGRGSSGGSLVAFCLNITQVDPIKYGLVFSRFISEARIDLPDIDMDFEDTKRDKIMQHLKDLYGEHNVISLSTFAKMKGKGVVRSVGRVFDLPIADVSKAANSIVVRSGGDARADFCVKDAFEAFEDGKAFYKKYPKESEIAMELEGQIYGHGKHAAAMVVSANDLRDGQNANYAMRTQSLVCNWDKEDAEHMGLMKLDVLGLNSLTLLSEARKLIKQRHGVDIDYETLPLDDPKIFKEFSAGNNVGVFQFNSPGMMRMCREIGVEDFNMIVALNTLHRPGSLRSGIATSFQKRKHGEEPVTYIHPFIEEITRESYGLIIYQEQVMRFMYDLGGMPWKTTDTVRKVISKSKGVEQFLSFKQQFVDGCVRRKTLEPEIAEKMFEELKFFGSYSFNKSHSVEYSLIAYWMMYVKVYYPAEFMATILSYGNDAKKSDNIQEARRLGLKLVLPDINASQADVWSINSDGHLVIPLSEIKGVGEVASRNVVKERDKNGPYKDLADLERRVNKRSVNSKVRGLLSTAMCFDNNECKGVLDEARLDQLSQYFDFSLSNDPMYRYRKMIKLIATQAKISPLNTVVFGGKDRSRRLHFGVMDKLKFGYKEHGDGKKLQELRGTAGDLGGVYGNFKDDTDFVMLVFSSKFYREHKMEVEHCEGKWMLIEGYNQGSHNNIWTDRLWFGDDLLQGKTEGLGLKLAKPTKYPKGFLQEPNLDLPNCTACELHKECSKPVMPSLGQMNMMIVGEAPGRDEDRLGQGFVGDSGNGLWKRLEPYGLTRELFHVTNVNKCWPSTTRTPKNQHVKSCSKFLLKEIEIVRPFIILSFGNTGLRFFKDQESGIMAASGACEWHDRFGCWIVYSVHPAAALYSPENKEYVDRGITAFAEKIAMLGFGE
jgi:DNA polymerase-3 subunit alpha